MPLVNVKLAEGAFTEKQKHDLAASAHHGGRPEERLPADVPTTREDLATQAPVRDRKDPR